MKTQFDISECVLLPATVKCISIDGNGVVEYRCELIRGDDSISFWVEEGLIVRKPSSEQDAEPNN